MKFIGKETQKLLDQQTRKLEREVADLASRLQQASSLAQAKAEELAALLADHDKLSQAQQALTASHSELLAQHQLALAQAAEQQAALVQSQAERDQARAEVEQRKAEQAQTQAERDQARAEAEQRKAEGEQLKAERDQARAEAEKRKAEQAQTQTERDQARAEAETLKAEGEQLKAERDEQAKLAQQANAKSEDTAQENELLLLQLMQVQEELVEYYEEKGRFEKLYESSKARWDRLEKRYPNHVDFGAVELLSFDSLSALPCVTWRVKDYAQAGVVFDEFLFQTVLQDGQPALSIVADAQAAADEDRALVPKLLMSKPRQLEHFLRLSNTEFRQINAAAAILAQLEAGQWQGFELPAQFDLSFWRPSIKALTGQIKALPPVFRYDQVKLKRELINPDYEHLWLELHDVAFGARTWKKLEVRLGAALVQAGGFSAFPKYEVPLIDGKTKPFDSWYAESQDDNGAKLELRFALEKSVFDSAALGKLNEADRVLMLQLVYAMPEALVRLQAQQTPIHRPWATWTEFAQGAVKVLDASRAALAKASKLEAAAAKDPQAGAAQPLAALPAQATAKGEARQAPQPKVISISPQSRASKPAPQKRAALASTASSAASAVKPASKTASNSASKPASKLAIKPAAKAAASPTQTLASKAPARKTAARPSPAAQALAPKAPAPKTQAPKTPARKLAAPPPKTPAAKAPPPQTPARKAAAKPAPAPAKAPTAKTPATKARTPQAAKPLHKRPALKSAAR